MRLVKPLFIVAKALAVCKKKGPFGAFFAAQNGPGLRGAKLRRSIWFDRLPGAVFPYQKAGFTTALFFTGVGMHAVQLPFPIGIEPLFHDDVMPHYPAVLLPGL